MHLDNGFSGTQSLSGLGISSSTTVLFAETILWTCVRPNTLLIPSVYVSNVFKASNVKPTKPLLPVKSALLLGVSVT